MNLKKWARLAAHPALPELKEEIDSLKMLANGASEEEINKL